jgi:coatomer protein complex subunit alpha (xenin)
VLTQPQARALINTAAQYVLAMSVELERRKLTGGQQDISSLPEDARKRALELSAYFTIPEMDPSHVTLALFSAMNFAQKNKQFSSALTFANNIIEKGTNTKFKESVSSLAMLSSLVTATNSFLSAGAQDQNGVREEP